MTADSSLPDDLIERLRQRAVDPKRLAVVWGGIGLDDDETAG